LDWAHRRGNAKFAGLIKKAGAAESEQPTRSKLPQPLQQKSDEHSVRRAVSASLPVLQRSGRQLTEKVGCVTCHQHALLEMTVGVARDHGFPVDESIATQERAHVLAHVRKSLPSVLMGTGIETSLAPYILAGLAADKVPASKETDALVHYQMIRQQPDGHWLTENYRPPEDASDYLITAMAVRGLAHYAAPGQQAEIAARLARAAKWLESSNPAESVDMAFRLLGLGWSGADHGVIGRAGEMLLKEQRPDGGWAQLQTLPSDAYATGLILFALREGGQLSVQQRAYQRGIEFLLRTQLADGSWYVPTRCFPFVAYTNSGFPHGKSQFISAAASCWATMALAETEPIREASVGR
jgi:hypothetical protein